MAEDVRGVSTTSSPTEALNAGKEKKVVIFSTRYRKSAIGSSFAVGEEAKVNKSC
jgi:hypothetical protein